MSSSPLRIKVRYIFVPLLELAVGFCVVYSALNWLLVARGNLVPLSDDVATYWLPLGLAWLLVIFKVQPGLRLLKRDKRQNLPILYHAAAVAMIAVPTILVQGFVRTATGDLTHVRSLADISSSNDTLNFYVYVAFPLCQMDRVRSRESVWVGYEFHKAVSNSLPTEKKDVAYNDFIRQSRAKASELDPKSFPFFERLGRSSNRKQFAALLARAGFDLDAPSTVLLIPHAERFEDRTGHHLKWALVSFGIGTALWLAIALLCRLDSSRVHKWREQINAGANAQPRRRALELLIPQKGGYGLQIRSSDGRQGEGQGALALVTRSC